jgi:hypothetical protein
MTCPARSRACFFYQVPNAVSKVIIKTFGFFNDFIPSRLFSSVQLSNSLSYKVGFEPSHMKCLDRDLWILICFI